MNDPIHFHNEHQANYELSNLSENGFTDDQGHTWPSVEHYVLGNKFEGELREKIRTARNAKKAKLIHDAKMGSVRPNWKEDMDAVMLTALRLKCSEPAMREKLLETQERKLVYACPFDKYWGAGRNHEGQNRVGELLMQVREELLVET